MELAQLKKLKVYDKVICNGAKGIVARCTGADPRILVEFYENELGSTHMFWDAPDAIKANISIDFRPTPGRKYWNASCDEVEIDLSTSENYNIWN